jgi:Fe-S oxidoreductase
MEENTAASGDFKDCLMNEPPYCGGSCPFHADIPGIVRKCRAGRYTAAYRAYRDAVCFPRTVAAVCPAPCREACLYKGANPGCEPPDLPPVSLPALESGLVEIAGDTSPNTYNIPGRGLRVAVVGAGPGGLACALRLAPRKCEVVVYEASDGIGGHLKGTEHEAAFLRDVAEQGIHEEYELRTGVRIADRSELNDEGFDAVYVATGAGTDGLGLDHSHCHSRGGGNPHENSHGNPCLLDAAPAGGPASGTRAGLSALHSGGTAWFAGGSLIGHDGVYAIADGLLAAVAIDSYIKTGLLKWPANTFGTKLPQDVRRVAELASQESPSGDMSGEGAEAACGSAGAEAVINAEAGKCLLCRCDACQRYCDVVGYYGKWPVRLKEEVTMSTLPGKSEVKATPAKRLISASDLSGVLASVCPVGIDLDGLLLSARQIMHRHGKLPWAFHDFWLRDMAHADGPRARLLVAPDPDSGYAFFPGCHLGASDPDLVRRVFEGLGGAGLLLRCCGEPAEWAGDEDLLAESLASFRADWETLGRPVLLCACPSCMKVLRARLADIPVRSVYEFLAENQPALDGAAQADAAAEEWALFDPCSASDDAEMRAAVRSLAAAAHPATTELPVQPSVPRCCGFGGLPDPAGPDFRATVTDRRIKESPLPYLTYCSNCRDAFSAAGKPARHILAVVFPPPQGEAAAALPTVSQRRENRESLKAALEEAFRDRLAGQADASSAEAPPAYSFALDIPGDVVRRMDAARILDEEVYEVMEHLTRTGRYVRRQSDGARVGCKQVGNMTYWVEWTEDAALAESATATPAETPARPLYRVLNVYGHRMSIVREKVWQGIVREDGDGRQ